MKTISRTFLAICGVMTILLASCSKDNETVARELLATVPSNAAMAVVVDVAQIVEKGGNPENLIQTSMPKGIGAEKIALIRAQAKSIDLSSWVIFTDGYATYLTFQLSDIDAFKTAAEKDTKEKFKTTDGVDCIKQVAVAGNQGWLLVEGTVNPQNIKGYTKLAENQSFLSNEYSSNLVEAKQDIAGLLNISSLFSLSNVSFADAAKGRMFLSALWDDAAYVYATADFSNGQADVEADVLTSKFKPAKFLLPMSKIDVNTVKGLGTSADILVAVNIDHSFVKRIQDIASTLMGGLPSEYDALLSSVDGTIAVAGDSNSAVNGAITLSGQSSTALSQLLSENRLQVSTEGNLMRFSSGGTVDGGINIAETADAFKNSFLAVAVTPGEMAGNSMNFTQAQMMFLPEGNALKLHAKLLFADKNKNALLQLLSEK